MKSDVCKCGHTKDEHVTGIGPCNHKDYYVGGLHCICYQFDRVDAWTIAVDDFRKESK
jgi:hypothetical protein